MQIGNIKLTNPLVLAPMAGVTDMPFRVLAKEFGVGLVVSEMVSAKGLIYNNKKTIELLTINDHERPVAIQIFGNQPEEMACAAKIVESLGADIIDINMGCPVPKIVNNGEGSALMKTPKLAYEIMARVADNLKIPLTVKIRAGWDETNLNAVELALLAEQAGVQAIAIHARTRAQFYSGQANWKIIKEVKSAVKIPVIANGDIKSPEDAMQVIAETNCDAIMIGRAAEGNVWIFEQMLAKINNNPLPVMPTVEIRLQTLLRHLSMLVDFKGEKLAVREMRRHSASYTKGLPYAAEYRNLFNTLESENDFILLTKQYSDKLGDL